MSVSITSNPALPSIRQLLVTWPLLSPVDPAWLHPSPSIRDTVLALLRLCSPQLQSHNLTLRSSNHGQATLCASVAPVKAAERTYGHSRLH